LLFLFRLFLLLLLWGNLLLCFGGCLFNGLFLRYFHFISGLLVRIWLCLGCCCFLVIGIFLCGLLVRLLLGRLFFGLLLLRRLFLDLFGHLFLDLLFRRLFIGLLLGRLLVDLFPRRYLFFGRLDGCFVHPDHLDGHHRHRRVGRSVHLAEALHVVDIGAAHDQREELVLLRGMMILRRRRRRRGEGRRAFVLVIQPEPFVGSNRPGFRPDQRQPEVDQPGGVVLGDLAPDLILGPSGHLEGFGFGGVPGRVRVLGIGRQCDEKGGRSHNDEGGGIYGGFGLVGGHGAGLLEGFSNRTWLKYCHE